MGLDADNRGAAMRVYVTGGGLGFIGGHVVHVLRERGVDVRDDYVDVLDAAGLERAMEGCDAVVHVAALYSYDRRDEAALARVNIKGTRTVLAAAARAGRHAHRSHEHRRHLRAGARAICD